MQFHALARALIENGGKVGGPHQLCVRDTAPGGELKQELIGIERVDAARSPRRLLVEERLEARLVLDQSLAHARQHCVAPGELIEPIEARSLALHRRDQVIRRKPLVGREIEDEADETVEVEIVRRHAGDDVRRRRPAVSRQVADVARAAIEPDDVNALHLAARDADRQVALLPVRILFVQEPESRIVIAAFELRRIEARQRLPQPVGEPAVRLGADRAVHEMGCVIGIGRGRLAAEPEKRDAGEDKRRQSEQQQQDGEDPDKVQQPHARPQGDLDGGEWRVDVGHRDITSLVGVTISPCTR